MADAGSSKVNQIVCVLGSDQVLTFTDERRERREGGGGEDGSVVHLERPSSCICGKVLADRAFYRMSVARKTDVPWFGPDLATPMDGAKLDADGLRSYILTKRAFRPECG